MVGPLCEAIDMVGHSCYKIIESIMHLYTNNNYI